MPLANDKTYWIINSNGQEYTETSEEELEQNNNGFLGKNRNTIFNKILIGTNLLVNVPIWALANTIRSLSSTAGYIAGCIAYYWPDTKDIEKVLPIISLITWASTAATSFGAMCHELTTKQTDDASKYLTNFHQQYGIGRGIHKCLKLFNHLASLTCTTAAGIVSIFALKNLESPLSKIFTKVLLYSNLYIWALDFLPFFFELISNITGGILHFIQKMGTDVYGNTPTFTCIKEETQQAADPNSSGWTQYYYQDRSRWNDYTVNTYTNEVTTVTIIENTPWKKILKDNLIHELTR